MKKQLKWLVAALALTALATPAFAVTADVTGSLQVRAFGVNNFDGDDDANDHGQFVDQRLRLFTNAAANENVKAVFGIEVDNVWGTTNKASAIDENGAKPGDKQLGSMGTDAKGEIEIKHLYLDFNLPDAKANIKAGSQAFNLGRGFIINDDAAGVQAAFTVADNPLTLYWIKPYENDAKLQSDDADFYGAKYTLKSGDVAIAPYVGYTLYGENAAFGGEATSMYLGLDVDGKAGDLGYGLTAIFNSWDVDGGADGGSIALLAKADYTTGDTKLSIEAARYGDEDAGGDFVSLKDPNAYATGPINNFSEIITGGLYTSNTNDVNYKGAGNLYSANYLYLKLGLVQKLSEATKVSGYVMHVQQAEDTTDLTTGVTSDAITFGQEVDLYFDYAILPGLGFNAAAAYLLADSDFGEGDDAWKLATSLNYKF